MDIVGLLNVNDTIRMYEKCNIKMSVFLHSFVILLIEIGGIT